MHLGLESDSGFWSPKVSVAIRSVLCITVKLFQEKGYSARPGGTGLQELLPRRQKQDWPKLKFSLGHMERSCFKIHWKGTK